jgi:hypothetical protein
MNRTHRVFRTVSLVVVLLLGLAAVTVASARPAPAPFRQATAAPVDPDEPVALTLGKAVVTPIDDQNITHRVFTFKAKANQLIAVSAQTMKGNFMLSGAVSSQNDVEIARVYGGFMQSFTLVVKVPQDGTYRYRINEDTPGAGDFEAGEISVLVEEAKPAAAATATK